MKPMQFEPPDDVQTPEYSQSVNVRVTRQQKSSIRNIAYNLGISESALVRSFIIQAIDQLKGDENVENK